MKLTLHPDPRDKPEPSVRRVTTRPILVRAIAAGLVCILIAVPLANFAGLNWLGALAIGAGVVALVIAWEATLRRVSTRTRARPMCRLCGSSLDDPGEPVPAGAGPRCPECGSVQRPA